MLHHEGARLAEERVIAAQRGTDSRTAVARGGMHVQLLERRLAEDAAVGRRGEGLPVRALKQHVELRLVRR
jgi:hypothetical protein